MAGHMGNRRMIEAFGGIDALSELTADQFNAEAARVARETRLSAVSVVLRALLEIDGMLTGTEPSLDSELALLAAIDAEDGAS